MRRRLHKREWVAALSLVVAVFSACSGDDDGVTDIASPPPTVVGTGGFLDVPEEREWGDIYFTFEGTRAEDQFVSVYFVAQGSPSELYQAAEDCVEEHLRGDYFGASCYAFDNENALEIADPDPATGGMKVKCWRAFFSDSEGATQGAGTTAGADYRKLGCP